MTKYASLLTLFLLSASAAAAQDTPLVSRSGTRPLVRGGIEDWERIFTERRPVYEQLANETFDTSRRPYSRIAEEVAEWARKQ